MVEGGASVIRSFLDASQGGVVDTIIVTVAPTFVGEDAVGYGVQLGEVRLLLLIVCLQISLLKHAKEWGKIQARQHASRGGRYSVCTGAKGLVVLC